MMFLEVINEILADKHVEERGVGSELRGLAGYVDHSLNCLTLSRSCYNCDVFLTYTHICTHTYTRILKISCFRSYSSFTSSTDF